MMTNEIKRAYIGSDDYMLETSSTLQSLFVTNVADFTALDTTLTLAYGTTWLNAINAAGTVVRDSQVKDILAQRTNAVLAQMELCKLKYNEVKYFATKVFPKDRARQAEFGTDTYMEARQSHSKMISFLDEMHKACVKYQAQLIAGGLSAIKIADIQTLRTNLQNLNTSQEGYIRARPVLTQDRITVLNNCYNITKTIIEAAQVIYYNDIARRQQYVYLPSQEADDSEIIELTISSPIPVLLKTQPYSPTRQYNIVNNGPAAVEFYISNDPLATTLLVPLNPGDILPFTAAQLGTEGSNLYARLIAGPNTSAQIEVEIMEE